MPPPPPTTTEEPRYNGVDHQSHNNHSRHLIPGTSRASTSNATVSCSHRNGGGRPVAVTTATATTDDDDYIIPTNIDPPKGFEPTSDSSNTYDNNNRTNNSSPSRGSSSSTSAATESSNNRLNGQVTNAQASDNDLIGRSTQRIDGDIAGISNDLSTSSQEGDISVATMSNHSTVAGVDGADSNKEIHNASTSSTYKFVTGFNSIVNKISRAIANTSLSMINTDRCLQDEMPRFAFGHKRTLEKTWTLMDKVVKCCQRPRMNLNNSPPFILEILPETYQHLKLIHTKYNSSHTHPINDNDFSQVSLRNLQNRCKRTLKLFKDAKEEMFNEESDYRHQLTRHTLVFNHILSELKATFPNGTFIGDKYLITKKESAGEFWKNSFGSSVLVDWRTFYHALQQVHSIDSSFFSLNALKQTIDLTCDDYISIFEFDVFTRLFQPWSSLLRNWQILAVTHPGYKAFLTYDELKARLQKHIDKPGSYVFRLSCTRLGQWAIGYVTPDRQILQTIVQNISLSQALTETKFYLYPDGKDEDPSLSILCSGMSGDERNVTVTEEQYEIYCGVGNSFQTCKICFENDKDIRVEPCNHLLCTSCLQNWQESEGQGCPYCRTEIKETVQITMELPRTNR